MTNSIPASRPNATITVSIHATGTPGLVMYEIVQGGAVQLTDQEIAYALRTAAESLEEKISRGEGT